MERIKGMNLITTILAITVFLSFQGVNASGEKVLPNMYVGKDGAPMILIPDGYFMMGSMDSKRLNAGYPRHRVYLNAYYIDVYPVTFEQFDKFSKATGARKVDDRRWGRGKRPVCDINWNEAHDYCQWAGKRLPTEAEWEKACRGGTDTVYFWGDNPAEAETYAWYSKNSGGMTHPVGEKKPNPYGLYDILGNVWEWCSDWFRVYPNQQEKNPMGIDSTAYAKILRGGSWVNPLITVADRLDINPDDHSIFQGQGSYNIGCRCAKDATEK